MSKTGRVKGNIFRVVREVARTLPRITAADFPSLRNKQAVQALHYLARRGELKVVEKGRPGRLVVRYGVFARTPLLRDPSLTNQQL